MLQISQAGWGRLPICVDCQKIILYLEQRCFSVQCCEFVYIDSAKLHGAHSILEQLEPLGSEDPLAPAAVWLPILLSHIGRWSDTTQRNRCFLKTNSIGNVVICIQCGAVIKLPFFLLIPNNRHHIARPWRRSIGCLLLMQISIHVNSV